MEISGKGEFVWHANKRTQRKKRNCFIGSDDLQTLNLSLSSFGYDFFGAFNLALILRFNINDNDLTEKMLNEHSAFLAGEIAKEDSQCDLPSSYVSGVILCP